jgi:hypothetical protein
MTRVPIACLLLLFLAMTTVLANVNGIPITRIYPLEEIGRISQGGRLAFDRFGRIAVVQEGAYVVLNDSFWTDIAAPQGKIKILQAACDNKETTYYGALGNWGMLVADNSGSLYPQPFEPDNAPKWVADTNFTDILVTPSTVYFSGWNGIAARDTSTGKHRFFEATGLAKIFKQGNTVYVSSHSSGLMRIDDTTSALVPSAPLEWGSIRRQHSNPRSRADE